MAYVSGDHVYWAQPLVMERLLLLLTLTTGRSQFSGSGFNGFWTLGLIIFRDCLQVCGTEIWHGGQGAARSSEGG